MNGYKKSIPVFMLFLFVYVFSGCKSVSANVSSDSVGTVETRNNIAELRNGQTELAVTGERIENASDRFADGLKELDDAAIKGSGDIEELRAIIRAIRERETKSHK